MDPNFDERFSMECSDDRREVEPAKPSRAAEYIALLYLALLLCAPLLLRDSALLTPPDVGAAVQVVNKASAHAPVDKKAVAVHVDASTD